jgi:hypothetical protein
VSVNIQLLTTSPMNTRHGPTRAGPHERRIALAAVDGLALHAVSSGSRDTSALTDALDHMIDLLLAR